MTHHYPRHYPRHGSTLGLIVLALLTSRPVSATDLQPQTIAAFDRYVRLTEARMQSDQPFILIDTAHDPGHGPASGRGSQPEPGRASVQALQRGESFIEALDTRDQSGRAIHVPGGMIHHWVGLAFVRGATLTSALTLLQDYDAHARIYAPAVAQSALRGKNGDDYRVFLRFAMTKVLTVVVNSEHAAHFTRPAPDRAEGRIHSTRIAEVENPGTPDEREKPVGKDGGYLWRLNSYWRLLAADGGVYIQCESISLTRTIPTGLGWLVGPFVTSIPRESLTFTLETTRARLQGR